MKRILILLSLFVLTACTQVGSSVAWQKSRFHVVEGDQKAYFQYPDSGSVEGGVIRFDNCKINFGKFGGWNSLIDAEGRHIESKKISYEDGGSGVFESWFNEDNASIMDVGGRSDLDVGFWIYDDAKETNYECRVSLEMLIATLTNKPVYMNDRFKFSVNLLTDYKAEDMPSYEGVVMKKFVDGVDWLVVDDEGNSVGYKVEISFFGEENIMKKSLTTLMIEKYIDYEKEFKGDGVFVNEGDGMYAVRQFFLLSGDNILRGKLKVDSRYYGYHKKEFDELVDSLKAF